MAKTAHTPLRLMLEGSALVHNWQALRKLSGDRTACGAAVKANGYGLGAREVVTRLRTAGCKDFYVATWQEALEIEDCLNGAALTVLNGVQAAEMPFAKSSRAKPMLNTIQQVERWRGTGLPCDVMINTGMNRLGIDPDNARAIDWGGLDIDVLASHLASADEDTSQNADQLNAFTGVISAMPHKRKSLANSAGIVLGDEFSFNLTRPGLALYGGVPRYELEEHIRPVAKIDAQVLQVRELTRGDRIGYNATATVKQETKAAIISYGYADGYLRAFSNAGQFYADGQRVPVLGRVSMDLVILDIGHRSELTEGDWVTLPLKLPQLSRESGLSQYELLTSLGQRFERVWTD